MGNPQYSSDLHVIKVVSEEKHMDFRVPRPDMTTRGWHENDPSVKPNPPQVIQNYYDPRYFWIQNDSFNYFNQMWYNGRIIVYAFGSSAEPQPFILWMDTPNKENSEIAEELKKCSNVTIKFCEKYKEAERYIFEHKDEIKSSSVFQVICHGSYRDEKKTALDVLSLLTDLQLRHVPVLVYTSNAVELKKRFEKEASDMNLTDWKERLFITHTGKELFNEAKKHAPTSGSEK